MLLPVIKNWLRIEVKKKQAINDSEIRYLGS